MCNVMHISSGLLVLVWNMYSKACTANIALSPTGSKAGTVGGTKEWEKRESGEGGGKGLYAWHTLQQGCSIVDWLVGDHFVSGADAPRISQPVQMLDVTPAIIPHLRQI